MYVLKGTSQDPMQRFEMVGQITDPSGKWYGKVSSSHVDNRFYLRKDIIFPQEGMYQFEIFHGLRDTNVVGIKNVGLRIECVE